ncbi:hypothetical protein [Actinotalea sp. Marseille-Q4924]|uniref:hypothetical protein n=1 Tax=Actinotalea sp. Marseille-Q4924 TaxID=2866571 RepID=UPI001CE49DE4|nr:hypothetical protein [Actinotalea sp. Marseille-Q4924]
MTRRPAVVRRPTADAATVRALPALDVPPGDLRAAFDVVRAHPVVVEAAQHARSLNERETLAAARASLVRRSLAAASR